MKNYIVYNEKKDYSDRKEQMVAEDGMDITGLVEDAVKLLIEQSFEDTK